VNRNLPPYTALAEIYDRVMAHVDYPGWAAYLAKLIQSNAPAQFSVLELGCGTGSLTVHLASELTGSYLASDNAPAMLSAAKSKLVDNPRVEIDLLDFKSLPNTRQYDVVLLAYDGINYARDVVELHQVLKEVAGVVQPDGLFLFDQSTPSNSINNLSYFDDKLNADDISYARTSTYNEQTQIHVTRFTISKGDSVVMECHEQRAFTRNEMLAAIGAAEFDVVSMLEAFEFEPADDETERIQRVQRNPAPTENRIHARSRFRT
jgi:SAM-dependent methyltransferase